VNIVITTKSIFIGVAALAVSVSNNVYAQSSSVDTYKSILQEISDLKLSTAQKEIYLKTQNEEISNLKDQIEGIPATTVTVGPLLDKMAAAIESEIYSDYPFKIEERLIRLDKFRETIADPEATPGQKMRQALNIYDIEVSYGNSVASYAGNNPINPGVRYAACQEDQKSRACGLTDDHKKKMAYVNGKPTGNGASIEDLKPELMDGAYLHYGRLSFVYLEFDSSEAWRYDLDAKNWVELSGSDVLDVRRAVRIARGQSAPGVLSAPGTGMLSSTSVVSK
jgi:hypothetical protein